MMKEKHDDVYNHPFDCAVCDLGYLLYILLHQSIISLSKISKPPGIMCCV